MNAKEYLSQALNIDRSINSKLEQVASLHELATKATTLMSDMLGSPNRNIHKMEDAIVKMVELEDEIYSDIHRLVEIKTDITDNGVLIENAQVELESFALLFEFDGDQRHIRHVLYNCAASRPGIEGKTNEDTREVQTETLTIKATPLSSGLVKAKTGNTTDTTVYNDWYKAVYMPVVAEEDEGGVA